MWTPRHKKPTNLQKFMELLNERRAGSNLKRIGESQQNTSPVSRNVSLSVAQDVAMSRSMQVFLCVEGVVVTNMSVGLRL